MEKRPSRLRSFAANLGLLLAGTILALGVLEVALRIHNPFYSRIKGNRLVLTANTQVRVTNIVAPGLDREVTVTRNALGFRGPNPPADLDQRLTLIAIGGSTTESRLLAEDSTWVARLGRLLEPSFHGAWINNAGIAGHTTYGHLVMLEDYVAKLRPKVVLFLVGINDVGKAGMNDFDAGNVRGGIRFGSLRDFLKSATAYSEVATLVAMVYRSMLAHQLGLRHEVLELKKLRIQRTTPEEERALVTRFAAPPQLGAFAERLQQLIRAARAGGAEPVFMTEPALPGVGVDDVTGLDLATLPANQFGNGRMLWDLLEAYNDVTRRVCREQGVKVIDVAQEMRKSSRYFYDLVHFNNRGADEFARLTYRSLCPWLASRYPGLVTGECADVGERP